jgi:hypothetical protein
MHRDKNPAGSVMNGTKIEPVLCAGNASGSGTDVEGFLVKRA